MAQKSKGEGFKEIEGQLTLWDMEITKKPTPFTKIDEKITEMDSSFTEILKEDMQSKNEKPIRCLELTDMQRIFLKENKVMENDNLSKVVLYCGGGLGIEVKEDYGFKTLYINRFGIEEFKVDNKMPILPMDKIIYYKEECITNNIQEEQLRKLREQKNIQNIIRRKGDGNIIIELQTKIISINSKGWILEFNGVQSLYDKSEIEKQENQENIEEVRKKVKEGDIVEAYYGETIITGRICRVYGPDNVTLNIIFDNEKKHTAICRLCIKRLIKSA
ncbi:hypothetical protein [Clostridium sp. HMP27]|uniref:hypothetical protein n=1 Tax=Clostridium sp. HMP27 TaxID=1487921 RepID=UPI00052DD716|nr:hypothetical protein [Clostridium sp. HMP27]KGK88019.1 hypothetical protein DP68_08790 [Clostridium sp. HMP27]